VLPVRIGHGGMATAYDGFHPRLDVEVPVVVIFPGLDGGGGGFEGVQRFFREAQLAAVLRSNHLVRV